VVIILTLMFCMSVLCIPALAVEVDREWDEETVYDEQLGIVDKDTILEFDVETPIDPDAITEIVEVSITENTELRPFTPDGTGTVVDNATNGDGKEFYTIMTEDESVFHLIIDRQRNTQNVYFLNAVTEEDLMALAEKNGRTISSGTTGATVTSEQ